MKSGEREQGDQGRERGEWAYLDENLGSPNLPVMVSQHPLADASRGHLEVCHICHRQSRHQHTVAVHKLIEGVTNWVASPTDPGRWDKTAQIKSLTNFHTLTPSHPHSYTSTLHTTHPHPPAILTLPLHHTLTSSHPHTLTYPQASPYTLIHPHVPTLPLPHTLTLTHPQAPPHTLTHPQAPPHTLTHPQAPPHTFTHPQAPPHTLT